MLHVICYMLHEKSILIIDITTIGVLTFVLLSRVMKKKIYCGGHLNLLICLDKFLKEKKVNLKQLKGIALLEGGGTFSAVRGAAAILNALHLATLVPVWGADIRKFGGDYQKIFAAVSGRQRQKSGLLKPIYTGEPHITMKHVACNM